jgi:hypothetical protein
MLNKKAKLVIGSIFSLVATTVSAVEVTDICPGEASRTSIYNALKGFLIDAQAQDNGGFGLVCGEQLLIVMV